MKAITAEIETRSMQPSDLNLVMIIEQKAGPKSNPMGGEWTKEDFCSVLRTGNHQGVVAVMRHKGRIKLVGFAVYCLMPDKIHICNMAVYPDYQNLGVGTQIIDSLKAKLRPSGRRKSLEIDIRETNLPAQLYLKKRHFRAISVIRNWYEQPVREDAYKFQYKVEK